jgi:hypothetical protein
MLLLAYFQFWVDYWYQVPDIEIDDFFCAEVKPIGVGAGLPDGIFSNPKCRFG